MTKNTPHFNRFPRRAFLAGCAACALAPKRLAAAPPPMLTRGDLFPKSRPKVMLTFSHSDPAQPIWPNIGYDFEARKREIAAALRAARPEMDIETVTLTGADQAAKLAADPSVDGFVSVILGIGPGVVGPEPIIEADRPMVLADDLYGGTGLFLGLYGRAARAGKRVAGVSSADVNDIAEAAKCFKAIKHLSESKILDVTERDADHLWGGAKIPDFENKFGTKIELLNADQLNEAYTAADREAAKVWADRWIANARQVVEPPRDEIENSGAMYVALQNLMRDRGAQAIAIDCLGMYYADKMRAYPCMGFFQLNNDGLVGACESDLYSTLTMLMMGYLTGAPGYISDPVIDEPNNLIIYAHCVATNQAHGPEGEANAYDIRDHSEDRKGAAVRSLMPLGEMTTTMIVRPAKNLIVMHQAKTCENVDNDKACRTKLAAEVIGDTRKLLRGWDHGWHRVTFYGDHKRAVEDFAALMGIEVVHEA